MKERINEQNEEIERANELNTKMRAFVKLVSPAPPAEADPEAAA